MTAALDERFAELPTGITICYAVDGPDEGTPLLLVAGLGQQLHAWPAELVDDLVARGFRVIRLDNRDAGRSSRIDAPPPATWRKLLARARPDAYSLGDMAEDVAGLLDHLGVRRAHVVGMSMGGMIAQTLAAEHPERVLGLVSIISTTGRAGVGQPAWSTKLRLARRPARTRGESIARHLGMTAHLAGTAHPLDPAAETAYAELAWERVADPRATGAGTARQIQAIQASGDRTAQVRGISAPTLVVHGDRDLIVHPSGGRTTAQTVPGARLVVIPGMGHHLAPGVLPRLVDLISQHARGVAA
ncbi:alpha/beta fold hydrolase [Saccharopolyspora griseoalba]|uniref:Alpha/beta fold hydrolase n=1 Tax=Saccharopolyspora griseoalba TaxID=1431848 RepID=A0ABW2LPE8_9PSEU